MPVMTDALDRSLLLAAAMDSRGYGRRGGAAPGRAAADRGAGARRPASGSASAPTACSTRPRPRSLGLPDARCRARPRRPPGSCSAGAGSSGPATGPTRGRARSGASRPAAWSWRGARWSAFGRGRTRRRLDPSVDRRWGGRRCPRSPALAVIAVGLLPGVDRPAGARGGPPMTTAVDASTGSTVDLPRRRPPRRIRDVDLPIAEGELCVVIGRTGSGKSTLLGAVNGLVPHFTGGLLAGSGHRATAATPRTTRPASWPTSSAWSARTRWPGSSPTPSRRSSPTRWSSSASPRRDAQAGRGDPRPAGHRRAAPTGRCATSRAVSSSGWRSARC